MTWGAEGPFPIPNGTTWESTETGKTWTAYSSGSPGLQWGGFNLEFHLYSAVWSGSAWGAYTEITDDVGLFSFQTNRGIADWWRGMRAGSASLIVDFDVDDFSTLDQRFYVGRKIQLTVDVPHGEHSLFTGFVSNRVKVYDSRGYPKLQVQLLDLVGWIAQSNVPVSTGGPFFTNDLLRSILLANGATVTAGDVAGITASTGLLQTGIYPAGNLVDLLNTYVRGVLGVLWVTSGGVFYMRNRDWWYPFPDPVATIGSTDRGAGGTRDDPAEGDTGWKFPAAITRWNSPVNYTEVTWNHAYTSTATKTTSSLGTGGATGVRAWNDTVLLTTYGDVGPNLSYLLNALSAAPYDSTVTIRFPADLSFDAMNYASLAEICDYIEVAKETTLDLERRQWDGAHIIGIRHQWEPASGWICEIDATLQLLDEEVDPG